MACLMVGRQRTASKTVEVSSSLTPWVEAMWDWSLSSSLSSSQRMVSETPCCEWSDAWQATSETAEFRSLHHRPNLSRQCRTFGEFCP